MLLEVHLQNTTQVTLVVIDCWVRKVSREAARTASSLCNTAEAPAQRANAAFVAKSFRASAAALP